MLHSPADSRRRIYAWSAAIILATVATGLHIFRLFNAGAFWRDEFCTFFPANASSFSQGYELLKFDSFPGFFHLLYAGWLHLTPQTLLWHRAFGTLIGIGGLCGVLLLTAWYRKGPPLWFLSLAAVHPMILVRGDSIRAYGLGTFMAVASAASIWFFLKSPGRRSFALAAVLASLMVMTLYQNALYLGAFCLAGMTVAAWRRRWAVAGGIAAIGLIGAMSELAHLPIVEHMRQFRELSRAGTSTQVILDHFWETIGEKDLKLSLLWIGAALYAVITAFWIAWRRRNQDTDIDLLGFAGIAIVLSIIGHWLYLMTLGFILQDWYYLEIMVVIAVGLDAIAIGSGYSATTRTGRIVLSVAISAIFVYADFTTYETRFTTLDVVGQRLRTLVQKDDLIVVTDFYIAPSTKIFYDGPAELITIPPMNNNLNVQRIDLLKDFMSSSDALAPVRAKVQHTLETGHDIYIVGSFVPPSDVWQLPPPPLRVTGWQVAPYIEMWWQQFSNFVTSHVDHAQVISVPLRYPVMPEERNSEIIICKGWHDLLPITTTSPATMTQSH